MEPVSISFSAASVAQVAFTILKKTAAIIACVANADESVKEFHASIQTLAAVLANVQNTFKKGKKQQAFEKKHWEAISNIIQSLHSCLNSLNEAIPEAKSSFGNAISGLMLEWKSELISVKRAHISSYTQFLQVSMSAVLLAHQRHAQTSQEISQLKIQTLMEDIQKAKRYHYKRKDRDVSLSSASGTCDSEDVMLENQVAARNVAEWVTSTEKVAKSLLPTSRAGESTPTGDESEAWPNMHAWRSGVANSVTSDDDIEDVAESSGSTESPHTNHGLILLADDTDAESDLGFDEPRLSDEYLDALITAHQQVVSNEIDARLYKDAEGSLRKLISLLKQKGGENCVDATTSEQELARVLYEQRTRDSLLEGELILKNILNRKNAPSIDEHPNTLREKALRASSVKHALALIYIELGRYRQALKYAMSSLVERKANNAGAVCIDDSCLLLASIHERMNDPISAAVWRKSVQRQIPPEDAGVNVFDWLRTNGFLPNRQHTPIDHFYAQMDYLNARHPRHQQTPLQFAITRKRDPEIVRALLAHGAAKETVDDNGATPLLLAAETRHKLLVGILLEHGVNTIAIDNDGNSALHRVQAPSGGTGAAKLLLEMCPGSLVDAQDRRGRTPLHYAAEFGNLQMVESLLNHRIPANVNAKDFGHDTPLHLAIYERRNGALIKLLVAKGADISSRNVNGKDALQTAKDMQTPMQAVVDFLKAQKKALRRNSGSSQRTIGARMSRTESLTSSDSRRESYRLSQVRREFSSLSLPFSSGRSVASSGS